MIGLLAGSEVPIHDSDGEKRWGLRVNADFDIELARYNADGVFQEIVLSIDSTTGAITQELGTASVTPVESDQPVTLTALDGTPAITATSRVIEMQKTANTTTAITMTVTHDGHIVHLKMITGDADSVYTAAVVGGTITFNAAEEAATVYCDGSTWRHLHLTGATFA